jgi:hypothetical protein
MAGMAAKMFARNAGKMGRLANRVPGLAGGLGAGAAAGVSAGSGMQAPTGAPPRGASFRGIVYMPNSRSPESKAPEPKWTPDAVQSTFPVVAGATAVAGAGYMTVSRAPGILASWGPTVIFIICMFIFLGLVVYFTFFRKRLLKEKNEN